MYNKHIPKLRSYNLLLVSQALWYYSIVTHRKCIAKHMISQGITADWCTTKPIAPFSCTPCVQQVHSKAEVIHLILVSQAYWYYSIVTHRKCIAKHIINQNISADWCMTKPIEPFSCTPRVQQIHSKAENIYLTPDLQGFVYYSVVTYRKCIAKYMINQRIPADWCET